MNLPFQRYTVWLLIVVIVTMLAAGAIQMEWVPAPVAVREIAASGMFRAVAYGVIMLGAIVLAWMENSQRQNAQSAGGDVCPKCEYRVRVQVGNRCSECGTVFDAKLVGEWRRWVNKPRPPTIGMVILRAIRGAWRWVWGGKGHHPRRGR